MQTLTQIRQMLKEAGLSPRKRFGQCFLVDQNLMGKLLELARLTGRETVLEVGAGTGALTEELLGRAGRVVAVEIDRGLGELLDRRLGDRQNLLLIEGNVLVGKHAIAPAVLAALGPKAELVANLPYSIATPLVVECLLESWRASRGSTAGGGCRFERLTFTVQQEVADRLAGRAGGDYGSVSVVAALLGRVAVGSAVPASAFWPRPKVSSRMVQIEFDHHEADQLLDARILTEVLSLAFAQRRKQMGSIIRRKDLRFPPALLAAGMEAAGIGHTLRAENVQPAQFRALANFLANFLANSLANSLADGL